MVLQLDNANLKRQNLLANVLKLFLFSHEGTVVSMTTQKGLPPNKNIIHTEQKENVTRIQLWHNSGSQMCKHRPNQIRYL